MAVLLRLVDCLSNQVAVLFDMFDRCDEHYGAVLRSDYTYNIERCCFYCLRNIDCFSAVYDPRTKICATNAEKATRVPTTGCRAIVKYLPLKSPDRSVLNRDCSSDDDCTVAHSHCHNGVCQCLWGYSNYPRENEPCLRDPSWQSLQFELGRGFDLKIYPWREYRSYRVIWADSSVTQTGETVRQALRNTGGPVPILNVTRGDLWRGHKVVTWGVYPTVWLGHLGETVLQAIRNTGGPVPILNVTRGSLWRVHKVVTWRRQST